MNRYTITFKGKKTEVYMIDHVMRFVKSNGYNDVTYVDLYKPNVDEYEIGDITISVERNV